MSKPTKLPEGWKLVSLGEVGTLINGDRGKNYPSQKDFVDNGVPFINAGHIQNGEIDFESMNFISRKRFDLLGSGKVKSGDILYCLRGSLGKTAIIKDIQEGAIASSLVIIRPSEQIRTDYFYRYLASPIGQAEIYKYDNGSSQPNLSAQSLKQYQLPLPPLEEQRRIAAILDKADGVRRKRKEAIRLTEELLKSTFLEMFGDPVTNPKGWEICELQNVCNRVTDGTHQPPNWADEGIPFLFVSNIVNGEIDFKVSKHITEESWFELTSRCPIEINDILYTTVGSYGNAALVRTKNRFCFQRHIAHIKPDSRSIEPEFLLGMMQSDWIRQQADKQARGVAQKTLNLRELKKFTIFTPPIEEQKKYVKLRQGVEKQLSYYRSALEQSENLFNSLLQKAFRGEL